MEPTRRQLIQLLAAAGMGAAAIARVEAQLGETLSADHLKAALAIHGGDLPPDRVETIRRALQQTLDDFAKVRALDVDDAFAPPMVFRPIEGRR